MEIRQFKTIDLNQIMNLWLDGNIVAHPYVSNTYWQSQYEKVKEMMPKAKLLVYEDNGILSGCIGLLPPTYIAGLFIEPASQKKGIGKKLLDEVKTQYQTLTLDVYKKKQTSH